MAIITNPPPESTLVTVATDDRTALGLFLPEEGNSARIDVRRIRTSLILLDAMISGGISDAEVRAIVAEIIDAAPATLDTLNELAAALGNDPNFATTIAGQIGAKANSADPTFTGVPKAPTPVVTTSTTQLATTAFVHALLQAGAARGASWTVPTAAEGDNDTSPASTAFVQRERLRGGTLTGAVAFTPGTLDVLTGGTKAVSYTEGNRRRFELRSGANVFNVTDIPESGGDLEMDLLYTAGTLGFTQTIRWKLGAGAESTNLGDTGVTLTAGVRYAVTIFNMGGTLYGVIG